MPIKKKNRERYPWNWRWISWHIIHSRAAERCEGILENGERCGAINHELHPLTGKKVVLSVAHLDHNPENSTDDNMRAFCQRCHNRWDREHRNQSIRDTYKEKHGEVMEEKPNPIYFEAPEGPKTEDLEFQEPEHTNPLAEMKKVITNAGFTEEDFADELQIVEESFRVREEIIIEKLKVVLQQLIKQLPPSEVMEHAVLLKALELRDELMELMNLPAAQLNTLQTQTRIQLCKQKQGLIDQLLSAIKVSGKMIGVMRRGTTTKADPVTGTEITEDLNFRGMGIRSLISNRKNDKSNSEPATDMP